MEQNSNSVNTINNGYEIARHGTGMDLFYLKNPNKIHSFFNLYYKRQKKSSIKEFDFFENYLKKNNINITKNNVWFQSGDKVYLKITGFINDTITFECTVHSRKEVKFEFFYVYNEENYNLMRKFENDFNKKRFRVINENKSYLNVLINTPGGIAQKICEIKKFDMNIELHYGKEFLEKNKKMNECLMNQNKGIAILHGPPGTGKTTYIRYLIAEICHHKDVYYIPSSYAGSLVRPEIIGFFVERPNSILVIEDAEELIVSRKGYNGRNNETSSLLNMTDGLLSDILGIQIICTCNTDVKNLDEALLRKGRLIVEHKFDKLNNQEVEALTNHYNIKLDKIEPMTLAEIFNIAEKQFIDIKKPNAIGFKLKNETPIRYDEMPNSGIPDVTPTIIESY